MFHLAHASAHLSNASLAELDEMPPSQQLRFAELCRYWSVEADRRARGIPQPKSGALAELARGERAP